MKGPALANVGFEKESGLKGSLRNLLLRKYTDKKAVDAVNLSIEEGSIAGESACASTGRTPPSSDDSACSPTVRRPSCVRISAATAPRGPAGCAPSCP